MSLGPHSPQIINAHLQILNSCLPNTPIYLCNAGIHLAYSMHALGFGKRKIEPIRHSYRGTRLSLADESFNVDQRFRIVLREMGFKGELHILGYIIILLYYWETNV
jgi:hypothetical protein